MHLLLLLLGAPGASAQLASSPTVVAVEIRGAEALPESRVRDALPVKPGEPYDGDEAGAAREMALSLLNGEGYLDAAVSAEPAVEGSSATIRIAITEGPLYRFGRARFSGLVRVPEAALRRALAFAPGDPYRRRALLDSQAALYGLGLLEEVRVAVSSAAPRELAVEFSVREGPDKRVRAGLGWGSEERERVTAALTHRNFLRRAYLLELSGTVAHVWREAQLELVNRHLLGTRIESRTQSSWRKEDQRGYDLERVRGRTELGRALPWKLRASSAYRLERAVLFNLTPGVAATTPEEATTSAASVSATRDATDDYLYPARGTRTTLTLEHAGAGLGGTVHFRRAKLDSGVYFPLLRALTGAVSARAGVVRPIARAPEVPVFERFFAGGANSVRGYRERGIGRLDALGAPLGGEFLLNGRAELRFPIWKRLAGAAFFDGGQVDARAGLVEPALWKLGAGGGLRVRTPVGPLRADLGWKVNPDPGERERWRLHLSLGEAF